MSGCFGRWRGTKRSGRCEERAGQGWEGGSLRSQPQSAVDRSRLHRRLAPKTCHTFVKVWLRTFGATAKGGRSGSARAVTQRRSDHAPRASLPALALVRTPAERERECEEWSSSEDRQQGRSIARATRGLRRPSLDARSLAQPCYLPGRAHRPLRRRRCNR